MNKSIITAVLATIGAGALLLSCSKEAADSIDPATGREATLSAPIEPYYDATGMALATRMDYRSDDKYGFSNFSSGDNIGLFIMGTYQEKPANTLGLLSYESGGAFVTNFPNDFSFSDGNVFGYYPWNVDLFYLKNGHNVLPGGDVKVTDGMPLRVTEENGDVHCIDLLLMRGLNDHAQNALQLNSMFKHAFSELLLVRGEGFNQVEAADKPKNNAQLDSHFNNITDIVIKLEEGFAYNAVRLTPNGATNGDVLRVELLPAKDDQSDEDSDNLYWRAWENESGPVEDGAGRTYDRSWSVILPTMADPGNKNLLNPRPWQGADDDPRTVIQSIMAYDNNGVLQTISDFSLLSGSDNGGDNWSNGKVLSETWRYNLIIEMQGTVPTISPWTIEDWKDDTDLTDTRRAGINDANEFIKWLQAYTTYLEYKDKDLDLDSPEKDLLQYGDRVLKAKQDENESDETDYWQFYVHTDLNWEQVENIWKQRPGGGEAQTEGNLVIRELYGVLDFRDHTVTNFKSSGGFIGMMNGKNAAIKNVTFMKPEITLKNANDAEYVGCIVDDLYNGSIINCQVVEGKITIEDPSKTSAVGMAAGQMCDAPSVGNTPGVGNTDDIQRVIMGCRFTGTISGAASSADGIVGSYGAADDADRNVLLNNANFVGRAN